MVPSFLLLDFAHNDVFFFKHSCIQSPQLNGLQMGTMIHNSVQDAGFDARELSHRSYTSVSMPASFIKFNAPSNLWTLSSYVKHVHLATVIIQTLTPQPKANDR